VGARRQELAHQHVETAIASRGDDLARAVGHLDTVGLAASSSDSAIVEGSQDPIRSAGSMRMKHPVATKGLAAQQRLSAEAQGRRHKGHTWKKISFLRQIHSGLT
jgi:hypothetical protein